MKYAKVRCLALLADPSTAEAIIAELGEYAGDADPELSRQAIRAVGKICLRLPGSAAAAIGRLIDFMNMDVSRLGQGGWCRQGQRRGRVARGRSERWDWCASPVSERRPFFGVRFGRVGSRRVRALVIDTRLMGRFSVPFGQVPFFFLRSQAIPLLILCIRRIVEIIGERLRVRR